MHYRACQKISVGISAIRKPALRWMLTLVSEMGMTCSRWADRLTIALEEVAE